jgi:hypothetical protein
LLPVGKGEEMKTAFTLNIDSHRDIVTVIYPSSLFSPLKVISQHIFLINVKKIEGVNN